MNDEELFKAIVGVISSNGGLIGLLIEKGVITEKEAETIANVADDISNFVFEKGRLPDDGEI